MKWWLVVAGICLLGLGLYLFLRRRYKRSSDSVFEDLYKYGA